VRHRLGWVDSLAVLGDLYLRSRVHASSIFGFGKSLGQVRPGPADPCTNALDIRTIAASGMHAYAYAVAVRKAF